MKLWLSGFVILVGGAAFLIWDSMRFAKKTHEQIGQAFLNPSGGIE